MILLPTAFIALRSPFVLAAVPSLALRFVGTNNSYWGTYWHYNATVMPVVFIAAIDAIARIRAARAARECWAAAEGGAGGQRLGGAGRSEPAVMPVDPGRLGAAVERHGAAMMLAIAAALAFQFPPERPVESADLHRRPSRGRRPRGHGARAGRGPGGHRPRPAGSARHPDRHLLARQQRNQPGNEVRRVSTRPAPTGSLRPPTF